MYALSSRLHNTKTSGKWREKPFKSPEDIQVPQGSHRESHFYVSQLQKNF